MPDDDVAVIVQETPLLFGADGGLVGVVTMPDAVVAPVAVLLINAGVIHRIGPHRINVKMARALAGRGFPSLRMDLSGLGDSVSARANPAGRDQSVVDMQAAMDFFERTYGVNRFLAVGVCSGAVNCYRAALSDRRVVGLLMFDGFTFPTFKTRLLRRWVRLRGMSLGTALTRGLGTIRGLFDRTQTPPALTPPSTNPSRAEFRTAMDALTARGVSTYVLYSHLVELHNYANQFRDAFRGAAFLERTRYDYIPHVDHTITPVAAQREFVGKVVDWVAEVGAAQASRALAEVAQPAPGRC